MRKIILSFVLLTSSCIPFVQRENINKEFAYRVKTMCVDTIKMVEKGEKEIASAEAFQRYLNLALNLKPGGYILIEGDSSLANKVYGEVKKINVLNIYTLKQLGNTGRVWKLMNWGTDEDMHKRFFRQVEREPPY